MIYDLLLWSSAPPVSWTVVMDSLCSDVVALYYFLFVTSHTPLCEEHITDSPSLAIRVSYFSSPLRTFHCDNTHHVIVLCIGYDHPFQPVQELLYTRPLSSIDYSHIHSPSPSRGALPSSPPWSSVIRRTKTPATAHEL